MSFQCPFVPAEAATQIEPPGLDSRWSLCSGRPKAGPEYGNERIYGPRDG
jgi:hypothetical protein